MTTPSGEPGKSGAGMFAGGWNVGSVGALFGAVLGAVPGATVAFDALGAPGAVGLGAQAATRARTPPTPTLWKNRRRVISLETAACMSDLSKLAYQPILCEHTF
jgi:hypothetical protein